MTPDKQHELADRFDLAFGKMNYLLNIDEARRIVYHETPKVACTSIKKYMIDQASGSPVEMEPRTVHDRSASPLRMLDSYSDAEIDAMFSPDGGYRHFCFVRDPYSRVLSAYLDKLMTNEWERKRHLPMFGFKPDARPQFVEFLRRLSRRPDRERDIHYMTQTRLTGRLAGFETSYIGHFENFKHDFLKLKLEFFGDSEGEDYQQFGKHHSSGADDKTAEYYGEEERALVRDIYAVDFAVYGYAL